MTRRNATASAATRARNSRAPEPSSIVGIPCEPRHAYAMDYFHTRDIEAVTLQEGIIKYTNKMWTIRTVSSYATSIMFSLIGMVLILFAPNSRQTAATIIAGSLFVVAVGIAGYTRFSARVPGIVMQGERTSN
jgi:hypothetical protein